MNSPVNCIRRNSHSHLTRPARKRQRRRTTRVDRPAGGLHVAELVPMMWFADVIHTDRSTYRLNHDPCDTEEVQLLLGGLELDNDVLEVRLINAHHYRTALR